MKNKRLTRFTDGDLLAELKRLERNFHAKGSNPLAIASEVAAIRAVLMERGMTLEQIKLVVAHPQA